MNMLADIGNLGGNGLIHQLIIVLLVALAAAVVYAIGWYFFKDSPAPPLMLKVWNGFFILVGGLVIVNFLLGLMGHPLIAW